MKNIAYRDHIKDNSSTNLILGPLFYFLGGTNTRIKILHSLILNNIFMPDDLKDEVFTIFSNTQKLYKRINRLVYKYNLRKMKIMNDTDLFLTDMASIKTHLKIILRDNNALYIFKLADLSNMIYKALSRTTNEMFPEPIEIRNPYNNIPFSKANLYNIYFAIKYSSFSLPILFQLYFNYEFDFQKFCNEGECLTKDISIEGHIKNLSPRNLYYKIMTMLNDSHTFGNIIDKWTFHRDFPKSVVMNTFKSYLLTYNYSKYSINSQKRLHSKQEVIKKLKVFREQNKLFGRKNISFDKELPKSSNNLFIFGQRKTVTYETSVKCNYNEINISRVDLSNINRRTRIHRRERDEENIQPFISGHNPLPSNLIVRNPSQRLYNRSGRQDRTGRQIRSTIRQLMNRPLPTPRDENEAIRPHFIPYEYTPPVNGPWLNGMLSDNLRRLINSTEDNIEDNIEDIEDIEDIDNAIPMEESDTSSNTSESDVWPFANADDDNSFIPPADEL